MVYGRVDAFNGDVIWNYQYLKLTEYDICLSIVASENCVFAMGGNYNGSNTDNHFTEYFFKLNQDGELIWEYMDRPEFDAQYCEEMLLNNGNLVVSSAYLDGLQGADALIYSLDTLNNLLWMGITDSIGFSSIFNNIVATCDHGFACSGSFREVLPVLDSINGIANESIILVKFDSIGNLLWQRKYHYLEAPSDYHRIYDMKATSDGGYIMVGEATDQTGASANWQPILPRQQAWILKVDACGCLVPGCDGERVAMSCGCEIPFFPDVSNYFLVGPNPASNSLNIYLGDQQNSSNESLEFHVHDMTGRLVFSFKPTTSNTTYIADVSMWAKGSYVLSLTDGTHIFQKEKILVVGD